MMELLLIKDVERLGKRGTRVSVKEGYARNFLLPLGYALPATDDNARRVEKARVQWLAEEAKLLEDVRELAGHLAKLDLKIVEKASETGHLYGSVSEKTIAEAVSAAGISIEAKAVRLDQPLKDVGDYEVLVRLHEEVELSLPVKVRAEGREDWVPGQDEDAQASAEGGEAAAEGDAPEGDAPAPEAPQG